ncbi:aminopeptidase N [Legionella lytica]|uniref:Aminopeptidase N n=1 Tax=Legionella lytica TaxID=96232 RepID=A0ABY4Y5A7_9GAMM|nr:aminopeptidase N [Legionella lytica]USQ12795.1 aminopeptidase N [Legionella lytica]
MPKQSDYKVLDFITPSISLTFDLTKEPIQTKALLVVGRNPNSSSEATDLHLNCENIKLISLSLGGKPLHPDEYELKDNILTIKNVPPKGLFYLEAISELGQNTDLFGLYKTEGTVLVKAETEGLRRVFPCIDRPDNLADYVTTIIANENQYPTLLSNGVLTRKRSYDNGVHSVTWNDPIAKPSYLFAMVAGDLTCSAATYKTKQGREVPIEFYLPKSDIEKCDFAKDILKGAMKYDEDRFNLEYLPELVKIAGVNKYASGASEPTGLILFNTANLLATQASRTDTDFIRVLDVVAHEYFHTWSGNLVTIRDWFNLSYKEGLTTLRASLFLEHCLGVDLDRMFDGRSLDERAPRPESYTAVRSLYTTAAYEKGAEIFRMIMNAMGEKTFNKCLSVFLKKNTGKAITLEDIIDSLSSQSNVELRPFLNWFSATGTPKVTVTDEYNSETKTYKIKCVTHDGKDRPIPVNLMLFSKDGTPISQEDVLMLDKPEMEFEYTNIHELPTPSLLRGFSAPIHLQYEYSNEQLLLLMQYDGDIYNKCKAAKMLITHMVQDYCAGKELEFSSDFIVAYMNLLLNNQQKTWVLAELLALPSEEALIASLPNADFEKIAEARRLIQKELGMSLKADLQVTIDELQAPAKTDSHALFDINAAGNRRLKSVCYSYLLAADPEASQYALIAQFNEALGKNMTETVSALSLLVNINYSQVNELLEQFYTYWKHDIDAINYWFNLQAAAHSTTVISRVADLLKHEAFDMTNPNKVNALLGVFIKNPYGFHDASGVGYELVASTILKLEQFNPSLAANLTEKFSSWIKVEPKRQKLMLDCLSHIYEKASTEDVRNMAKKELEKANVTLPSPKPRLIIDPQRIMWDFFADETPPRSKKVSPREEPSPPEQDPTGLFDDILNGSNVL